MRGQSYTLTNPRRAGGHKSPTQINKNRADSWETFFSIYQMCLYLLWDLCEVGRGPGSTQNQIERIQGPKKSTKIEPRKINKNAAEILFGVLDFTHRTHLPA